MSKFKKSPAHSKQVESFISGSDMTTRGRPAKHGEPLDTMTTRIRSDYLEKLRALSYVSRSKSQREIIEQALDTYFKQHETELHEAIELYKKLK